MVTISPEAVGTRPGWGSAVSCSFTPVNRHIAPEGRTAAAERSWIFSCRLIAYRIGSMEGGWGRDRTCKDFLFDWIWRSDSCSHLRGQVAVVPAWHVDVLDYWLGVVPRPMDTGHRHRVVGNDVRMSAHIGLGFGHGRRQAVGEGWHLVGDAVPLPPALRMDELQVRRMCWKLCVCKEKEQLWERPTPCLPRYTAGTGYLNATLDLWTNRFRHRAPTYG